MRIMLGILVVYLLLSINTGYGQRPGQPEFSRLPATSRSVSDCYCIHSDVEQVDFQNFDITTDDGLTLRLRNGRYFCYDTSFESTEEEVEYKSRHSADWEFVFDSARSIAVYQESCPTHLQIVYIRGDHITGTGTRNYLFVFMCQNGGLTKVFEQVGEGLQFYIVPHLRTTTPLWSRDAGHCCPTGEISQSWQYDCETNQFIKRAPSPAYHRPHKKRKK